MTSVGVTANIGIFAAWGQVRWGPGRRLKRPPASCNGRRSTSSPASELRLREIPPDILLVIGETGCCRHEPGTVPRCGGAETLPSRVDIALLPGVISEAVLVPVLTALLVAWSVKMWRQGW